MVPKTISLDPEFCTEVELVPIGGINGLETIFFGMDIDAKMFQASYEKGVLKEDKTGLAVVTGERQAITLSEQDAIAFYQDNKVHCDALIKAITLKIAGIEGKTGNINE